MKVSIWLNILGTYMCIYVAAKITKAQELNFNGNRIIIEDKIVRLWLKNSKGGLFERRISVSDSSLGIHQLISNTIDNLIIKWDSGIQLTVHQTFGSNMNTYRIELTSNRSTKSLKICVNLGKANWYGGGETFNQGWPIQNNNITQVAFVPNKQNGGTMDRYFLNSLGESIYYNITDPLFVSLSTVTKEICFICAFKTPYRHTDGRQLTMTSHVVIANDILSAHRYAMKNYFARPLTIPEKQVFRDPIWSTWARYKKNINQTIVLKFSEEIAKNGFPISQIEIDDDWERCYGDEVFHPNKFPDPRSMIRTLKQQSNAVTLWIHPFVNINCTLYSEGVANNYFVASGRKNVTGLIRWWDGEKAAVIDVTNTKAVDWWYQRLMGLHMQLGITTFKVDAGETRWLPPNAYLKGPENVQPGIYSTRFAEFANRFGGRVESRVGYRSGFVSIFIRMIDRDSVWGLDNGLHSVITSSLHMGLVGSPFVLPDYIGGNAYGHDIPDRELFIRWVQLTAFLPVMQFSITPWSFDKEVVEISRRMVALHQNISGIIIAAAQQATVDGSPIIRPLWWISPNDATAQQVNDQFLVGDTYLVAPVVEKGATQRDVYLPVGNWSDQIRGGVIAGPTWLRNYRVALSEISFFTHL